MNKNKLKIIFAGTPQFAVSTLQALYDAGHEILGVYTQPDRPAGRGQKLTASPVKNFALAHNLSVHQPLSLRDEKEQQTFKALQADVMIVVAYGLLLPAPILEAPHYGCINVHASLLPRWRGAAPIQRAILAGDTLTGISIMQMEKGLDTGPVLHTVNFPIDKTTTSGELFESLAKLGAKTLVETLDHLADARAHAQTQDSAQACYAPKIEKHEAQINWTESAAHIDRLIRAFNPAPIAYTLAGTNNAEQQRIRIWQAIPHPATSENKKYAPGTIITANPNRLEIATGDGTLQILRAQLPGGKPQDVATLLSNHKNLFTAGQSLGL